MYMWLSKNKTFCEKDKNDYKLNKPFSSIRELAVNVRAN